MSIIHADIRINGIVQGVGFRPFIHKLAEKYSIAGWIRNTNTGAQIEAEGEKIFLEAFIAAIDDDHPMLARIGSVDTVFTSSVKGFSGFRITESVEDGEMNTLISPDIGICEDCRRELFDPSDRRYRYPFINCTNCGPRFTIIKKTPYDRINTTMSEFEMCSDCSAEYLDIENRRYHAQPDCCSKCGPELKLLDNGGKEISGDPIANASRLLNEGNIVAVKGLGGFHLAASCDDPEVAGKLRHRKQRDERPLAIMCRNIKTAERYADITPEEAIALESFRKPIVLLKKRSMNDYSWLSENRYIGIMLPYTPLHCLLLEETESLIMTSANISELPIIYRNSEALEKLQGVADYFLLHNREVETRCDDSLMWIIDGREYPVRRSRGYVPYPLDIGFETGSDGILACGAEQKASFSVTKGSKVFPCQHIGDLKNAETLDNYKGQISHFEQLFGINVKKLVCDMHPDYMSTDYAKARAAEDSIPLLKVQHHHAHMASCMADNRITEKCIGVIWDGTGYGTDGTIWGGEFLTGDLSGFERKGRIRPVRLPGGDKAVKDIWRCGVSVLEDAGLDSKKIYPGQEAESVRAMLKADMNCPASSGMGRLFDAVSSITGIKDKVSYEGQGAVLLEAAAGDSDGIYPYEITESSLLEFDSREMIRCIINDISKGRDISLIAADFMNTLVKMAADICIRIRGKEDINNVVFSGGSFQNLYILKRLKGVLEENGFRVYSHSRVSTNDEGISFGQAAIAAWKENI